MEEEYCPNVANQKRRIKQRVKKRAKLKEKRPLSTLKGRLTLITTNKEGNLKSVINS